MTNFDRDFLRNMKTWAEECQIHNIKMTIEEPTSLERLLDIISNQEKDLQIAALMIRDLQEEIVSYRRGWKDAQRIWGRIDRSALED